MGGLVLVALFVVNALVCLVAPWIGVLAQYTISVLGPQYIWWWLFEDVRPSLMVTLPTLAGIGIALVRGKVSARMLRTRLNGLMAVLYACSCIAYFFGPYVDVINQYRFYDVALMFSLWQKTCLSYLMGALLIDSERKLEAVVALMLVIFAYMTWWANSQYFFNNAFGRLHGPRDLSGAGIYNDENNFAVLFVVGAPFMYYFGLSLKRRLFSWSLWAIIPMSWHGIFLTASRGALIATAIVLLVFTIRIRRPGIALFVLLAFSAAYAMEAGDLMKSRSSTVSEYQTEDSAAGRIAAWRASMGMMAAHPLTGVGFASFGQAFQDFSDVPPRIAHNTFFQIGGEWGVVAALAFLYLILTTLRGLWVTGSLLRASAGSGPLPRIYYINEACLLSLVGLFSCAMFLSLQQYEVLYLLLLTANAAMVLGIERLDRPDATLLATLKRMPPLASGINPSLSP
jgi:putative inorganic carbon (HCO3(-)) transporter